MHSKRVGSYNESQETSPVTSLTPVKTNDQFVSPWIPTSAVRRATDRRSTASRRHSERCCLAGGSGGPREPGLRSPAAARRQRRQRAVNAVAGADLDLGVGDAPLLVDDEVAADNTHVLSAVHRLLAPDAIGLGYRMVGVHQQGEG